METAEVRSKSVLLGGCLDLFADEGPGIVEGCIRKTGRGKGSTLRFSWNDTRSLAEYVAFEYERPKVKNHCVMRMRVAAV